MLKKRTKKLRAAAHQVAQELQEEANRQAEVVESAIATDEILPAEESDQPTLREVRFAEVKALQAEGWSRRAVAKNEKCMAGPILTCCGRRLLELQCLVETTFSHKLRETHLRV